MAATASPDSETLKALQAACKGLLWPSESDKPVKAFLWPASDSKAKGPIDADALRTSAKLSAEASIEATDLPALFAPLTKSQAWFGPTETANAGRFQQLQETLQTLADAKAFRVTSGNDTLLYLVGSTTEGSLAGVQTELVET